MAGGSLLLLLDDIAAVLDDVALMTKVAARKTAGVLGDDLALNAEQVSGVRAERELPVVWAVAKGSFRNKLILVPAALVISAVAPVLIMPLLGLGGLFLCYEGFEKVAHKFFHAPDDESGGHTVEALLPESEIDLVAFENDKIKGAIRTDFILSAEIIVLTLGIVSQSNFTTQIAVLSGIALFMTVGVYGLVAAIVKLDDVGLYLVQQEGGGPWLAFKRWFGARLLVFAPFLMKALAFVGTLAMFMVGGGIIVHGVHPLAVAVESAANHLAGMGAFGGVASALTPTVLGMAVGFLAGAVVFALMGLWKKLKPGSKIP